MGKWSEQPREWHNGYQRGYQAALESRRNRGIRSREDGFELRCSECSRKGGITCYWPLTEEFWNLRNLSVCRACLLERKRHNAAKTYWANPEVERNRKIEYHRANRKVVNFKARNRAYEYDEAKREAVRAYRRWWYARNRDAILARRKAA